MYARRFLEGSGCVLIAPLWNWNRISVPKMVSKNTVLIAPLWNWNLWLRHQTSLEHLRSNRTFMELKLQQVNGFPYSYVVLIAPLWNWNLSKTSWSHAISMRSNRTFMELKYLFLSVSIIVQRVLIAPLWNWNTLEVIAPCQPLCSNRTFMELKFSSWLITFSTNTCSYRTFMELKLQQVNGFPYSYVVLIAPLWNWNLSKTSWSHAISMRSNRTFMELKYLFLSVSIIVQRVLIAPLWNWNTLEVIAPCQPLCSNRTFMELKFSSWLITFSTNTCSNRTFMELKSTFAQSHVLLQTF